MIKLWIKHKLAELALNNMFNKLIQNFQTPVITKELHIGDKYDFLYAETVLANGDILCRSYTHINIEICSYGVVTLHYDVMSEHHVMRVKESRIDRLEAYKPNGRVSISLKDIVRYVNWSDLLND